MSKVQIANFPKILRDAKAKIQNPENWTKGLYAKDSHGHPVPPQNPAAVCWCALGAIKAITDNGRVEDSTADFLYRAFDMNRKSFSGAACPVDVNDRLHHQKVLELYDLAIKIAEEESNQEDNNV